MIVSDCWGPSSGNYRTDSRVDSAPDLCWRQRIGKSINSRHICQGGSIFCTTGNRKGLGARSLLDGTPLWESAINHNGGAAIRVSSRLVFCYSYQPEPGEYPYKNVWLNVENGTLLFQPTSAYGPPHFFVEGCLGLHRDVGGGFFLCNLETLETSAAGFPFFDINGLSELRGEELIGCIMHERSKRCVMRIPLRGSKPRWELESRFPCYAACFVGDALVTTPTLGNRTEHAVIDVNTGKVLWDLPERGVLWATEASIFGDAERELLIAYQTHGHAPSKLWCRDLYTGQLRWEFPMGDSWCCSESFFVTGDILWHILGAGAEERFLVARDIDTGHELNRIPIAGANPSVEWAEDGKLLVRAGGYLYCYESA